MSIVAPATSPLLRGGCAFCVYESTIPVKRARSFVVPEATHQIAVTTEEGNAEVRDVCAIHALHKTWSRR